MAISVILEVTIEGFGDKSEKGNFTARGVSFVAKSAKGCELDQIYMMAPNYGNNGTVLFMTKNEALATKVNKSKGAIGSKAKAMTAEDALAMVLADPAAMAKLAAALKK
jgi:hypothetical protein